jgi:hypothetical protein
MASRRDEDPQLTQAEIELRRAQAGAIGPQTQQEALRTAVLQQEQRTRAAAQAQAAREGEAKISQEQELTPFNKLLALSQAGAPALQARANKIKAAIDLYQTQQLGQIEANKIQAQKDIENQRARANTTDTLLQHAATLQIDPAVMREALKNRGVPELAEAYDKVRAADVTNKVEALKGQIPLWQKAGTVEKSLAGVTDPEVAKQLKAFIGTTAPAPTPAPAIQEGESPIDTWIRLSKQQPAVPTLPQYPGVH